MVGAGTIVSGAQRKLQPPGRHIASTIPARKDHHPTTENGHRWSTRHPVTETARSIRIHSLKYFRAHFRYEGNLRSVSPIPACTRNNFVSPALDDKSGHAQRWAP